MAGAAWMTALHIVAKGADLILLVVLARLLSPADFGITSAAYVFIELTNLFIEIGVGASLVQLSNLTHREVRTASTLVAINAVFFFAVAQVAAPYLSAFYRMPEVAPVLRVLAFIFLIQAAGITSENLLVRQLRAREVMIVQVCARVIGAGVVGIACAANGYGYWSIVIGGLVTAAIRSAGMVALAQPPLVPSLHAPSVKRLLGRGLGFSASRLLNFAALNGDNVIAGRVLGASGLGVYARAYRLMSLPADLYGSIAERLLFPAFAQFQADQPRLKRAFLTGTELTALVGLPLSAALAIASPEITHVVLGPKWSAVILPFAALAAVSYFRLGAKISGTILRSTAHLKALVALQALYAGSVIGLGVVGVQFGVLGLAVSTSVSVVLFYGMISWTACRCTGTSLPEFWHVHNRGVPLALATGALTLAVMTPLRAHGASAALSLAACMMVWSATATVLLVSAPALIVGKRGREMALGLQKRLGWSFAVKRGDCA